MTPGFLDGQLQGYLDGLSAERGGELGKIQRRAYDEGLPIISPHVAALLSVLLASKRPKRVLEIGCGIGFSAALFAGFLARGGVVTTIERYDYMAKRAAENFERLGVGEQIKLVHGDAEQVIGTLARESFDFIFMDCCKGKYLQFLPACMDLLAPGGMFAADDVLQRGTVAWDFERIARRQRTTYRNMRGFLEQAMGLAGSEAAIVPVGDGLLLLVKENVNIE